jgi:hypothetical protein
MFIKRNVKTTHSIISYILLFFIIILLFTSIQIIKADNLILTPMLSKCVSPSISYDQNKLIVMSRYGRARHNNVEYWVNQYVYIAFNLTEIPRYAIIKNVTFKIKTENLSEPLYVSLYCSNSSDWTHSSLTWNNKPGPGKYVGSCFVNMTGEWFSWDDSLLKDEIVKDVITGKVTLTLKPGIGDVFSSSGQVVFSNYIDLEINYGLDVTSPKLVSIISNATSASSGPVKIEVSATDEESGVGKVILFYGVDDLNWISLNMTYVNNKYIAVIPKQDMGNRVGYYVDVYDNAGNKVSSIIDYYNINQLLKTGNVILCVFIILGIIIIIIIYLMIPYFRHRNPHVCACPF